MMAKGLTDIAIRNLKAGDARREILDRGAQGLYVIVQPSGKKVFCRSLSLRQAAQTHAARWLMAVG